MKLCGFGNQSRWFEGGKGAKAEEKPKCEGFCLFCKRLIYKRFKKFDKK